ncbi:MAG: ribonuclease P protein component [Terriglobales bacterium]
MTADAPKRSGEQPAAKARASFPRAARLLKHSDFDRVYKQGRRHFSSHMTVYYLPHPGDALSEKAPPETPPGDKIARNRIAPEKVARVGFTVGKVLGGAVVRNRIKRRMREAVRQRRVALEGVGAVDIVINPKKSVVALEFSVLLEEVATALDAIAKKAGRVSEIKASEVKK